MVHPQMEAMVAKVVTAGAVEMVAAVVGVVTNVAASLRQKTTTIITMIWSKKH